MFTKDTPTYNNSQFKQKKNFTIESHKSDEKKSFIIHYNLKLFEVSLSIDATIQQLTQTVYQRVQFQLDAKFICLQSINKNQMIDYVLLNPKQKIKIFRKNQSFKVYASNYQNETGKPSLTDYLFIKCLGQGGSASVYLVRHKSTGKLYALKQIDKEYFIQFKRMEQILRQKKILSEILHDFPFIITLHSSFESQRHLNFVLEYYPGGQLFLHLQRRRFNENQAKLYFGQIVLTFEYLHKNKIVYRDLKPQNIMIDYQGHTKLADFGLCKLNLTRQQYTHSFCGSLEYMAPQVKQSHGYNYSVDFYTIGAFLYEMVVGVPPYYNDQPLYFPQKTSKSIMELVKGLIEKDVTKRIDNYNVIKKSAWLQNLKWDQIYNKRYEMPLKLNVYETYIHQEFSKIKVDSMNLMKEQKFDRLFDMFFYQRNYLDGRGGPNNSNPSSMLDKNSNGTSQSKKSSKNKSKSKKSHSKSKQKQSVGIQLTNKNKFKKSLSKNKSDQKNIVQGSRKPIIKLPDRLIPERLPFQKQIHHLSPTSYTTLIQSKSGNNLMKNTNFRVQSPSFRKGQNVYQVSSPQPRAIYFRKN